MTFIQTDLRAVLPQFQQHVDILTRGKKNPPLNHVYTKILGTLFLHVLPHSSLGPFDIVSLLMLRVFTQLIKTTSKDIKVWTDGALSDSFGCTDWHTFRGASTGENHISLEERTSAVALDILMVDSLVITSTVKSFRSHKVWLNGEDWLGLSRAKKAAFW